MKNRSDEPLHWLLFGAGGVVAALLLPVMILITGLLVPLGILNEKTMSYDNVHAFATSWWGALILLVVIVTCIYHAMHRVYHGLHDLGIHPTRFLHVVLYGFAFLVSAAAFTLLVQMF